MSRKNTKPGTDSVTGNGQSKWIHIRWFLIRLILMVYDIFAVNASVYLALITRFYVAKEFHFIASKFITAYKQYAVIYTVFCIVVFVCFKLYSGMWKYAGFNDLNRIVFANAVTFAGHVAGTIMFGFRMPITVYCIGAVIQLFLVGVSRFAYRVLLIEKERFFSSNNATVNALVVGIGGTAKSVVKQLEQESMVRPACMLNYKVNDIGTLFDGVPVVNGVENLKAAIEKHHINLVVLASTVIPEEIRNQIKKICGESHVEVQDYFGFFQNIGNGISLKNMVECCDGPVDIVINGQCRHYDDCEQAMMSIYGKYVVKSISAKNNSLVISLAERNVILNDLNVEWVKEQKQETGEDVSFF